MHPFPSFDPLLYMPEGQHWSSAESEQVMLVARLPQPEQARQPEPGLYSPAAQHSWSTVLPRLSQWVLMAWPDGQLQAVQFASFESIEMVPLKCTQNSSPSP